MPKLCKLHYSPRVILLLTTLASMLNPFISTSVQVALPSIAHELSLDNYMTGWIALSYIVVSAVLLIPFGKMADRRSHGTLFVLGLLLFSIANLFCFMAHSLPFLLTFRIVKGVGGALIYATAIPILTRAYPDSQRGLVIGINLSAVSFSLLAGPLLGGFIINYLGWRYLFLIVGLIAFGTLLGAVGLWNTNRAETPQKHYDYIGAFIYIPAIALLILGLTRLSAYTEPFSGTVQDILPRLLLPVAIILLILFFVYERHRDNAILATDLLTHNRRFLLASLAAWAAYGADFTVNYMLSFWLQRSAGLPSHLTGLVLMSQPLAMMLLSPFAGIWSDKIGEHKVVLIGSFIMMCGFILLALIHEHTPIWYIVVAELCMGCGFGIFLSPNVSMLMGSVSKDKAGTASAMLASMRQIGQSTGLSMAMLVATLIPGTSSVDTTHSTYTVMRISLVLMLICVITSLFCRKEIHK